MKRLLKIKACVGTNLRAPNLLAYPPKKKDVECYLKKCTMLGRTKIQ